MEWIEIENQNEIHTNGSDRILVKHEDGFMAVVYWDGYNWNIDGSGTAELDDARIFGKIKRYVILK